MVGSAVRRTHITIIAVVGWLILHSTLVADFLPCSNQLVSQDLDVLDGLHQAVSDEDGGVDCKRCKHTLSDIHTHTHLT